MWSYVIICAQVLLLMRYKKCLKQCLESFKTLQKNYNSEREKHSKARLEIHGYELALESLESRILVHEKNELAWGEKYKFQNYVLKCKEIKINNLNLELEKVVKERDDLKLKIEKWEESSKNLDELLNSQMSARDKTENTPANDRFSKADRFHAVPPPITRNFLTPRADISFAGKTNEANTQKPKTVYESVNRDKVIIEDWNSDDEDDVYEVQTVSPVKTNESQTVKTRLDKIGQTSQKQGIGFKKIKACFVCKRVLTRTGLITPVKQNEKRAVHTVSTARPVSTVRPFAPKIAQTSGAIRPIYPRMDNVRPRGSYSPIKRSYYTKPAFRPKDLKQDVKTFGVQNMTTAGTRAVVNTGKGKMDTDLKKSRWVWRPKGNYLDHVSKDNELFMLKKGNPEILLQDHAVVDSGCSSHMTGNKAYLSDYEDYNGGFVAFGSDPKGDELKFNLFSVSQMCDKKNSVLFTETECLILSPSFKLLDESQVVLRAPRKDDVYSLDLKNIVPSGGLENQLNHNVKIIRCDNGTEFKNHAMNEFCAKKGIKREFSVARTSQQNGVAERKNRTLIEAARTMLADSLLPIPFWAEAVNTACYVNGMRTRILVEDVAPAAHEKPFESSPKDNDVQDSEDVADKEGQHQMTEDEQVLHDELEKMIAQEVVAKALDDATRQAFEEEKRNIASQKEAAQNYHAASTPTCANAGESSFVYIGGKIPIDASTLPNADLPIDPNMPDLEDDSHAFSSDGIFNRSFDDENVGAVADFNNMDDTINVSPIPTLRIHKNHLKDQILGDPNQMSASDKTGLGYGTQFNEMSSNFETDSEISLSVFDVSSSDEENIPANDRSSKADGFHVVPPPITRNFLTPRANISFAGLDEYAIRKKIIKSKTTDLNTKTSETVDGEDDVSVVQTVSPVKTNETQTIKTRVDKIDCTFHDKQSQEPKLKIVVNIGPRVDKPVWDHTKRVNHQKNSKYPHLRKTFVTSGVLTRTGLITLVKQNEKRAVHTVSTARSVSTARPVSTVRLFAPKIAQTGGAIRPIYPKMDNVRPRGSYSPIKRSYYTKPAFKPKELKQDVKTFRVQNMTTAGTRAVVNTGKGKIDNDLKKSKVCWVWRPKLKALDHDSKNSGSYICKQFDYVDPTGRIKSVMAWLITEASLRRHLKLEDAEGISSLSNEEIFEQLAHMGSKKTTWDQFSSNIAIAIICLATSRRFNFSKFIFEGMVKNLDSPYKFLLYPRFIQLLLNKQQRLLLPHTRTHPTPTLKCNMRRASKRYSGVVTLLFESMLVQAHDEEQQQSPSRITPSPSLSLQPLNHTLHHNQFNPPMRQRRLLLCPMIHLSILFTHIEIDGLEKDLQQTKKTYSTALTKLVLRVKKLEYKLKSGKAKIKEEVHEKPSDETEVIVQEETPTEIIEEHGSGEKGEMEISTTSPPKVTKVSTAEAHVYTRRSAKDKGNAIMKEPPTPKKVKKGTQVHLSMDEELARKIEEEERARFNAEQEARALQEEEKERLNLEAAWNCKDNLIKEKWFQLNLLNLKELTGMIQVY
ncbi:ribonuclease H-like domain-containing protein [Tanacetum coccineum]|uniref:Ribonuclease H-like domain-containing protein n=1 Tax=Tanacetum coccineum TaxID=301880 RepID=A0ABQ4XBA8_9ASTR